MRRLAARRRPRTLTGRRDEAAGVRHEPGENAVSTPPPAGPRLCIALAVVLLGVELQGRGAAAASAEATDFCKRYAGHATSEAIVAKNLNCGFSGDRWSTDTASHMESCLYAFDLNVATHGSDGEGIAKRIVNDEDAKRVADLKTCQTVRASDQTKQSTASAPNGTTIYKQPNGDESKANIAGYVGRGKSVTIVECDGNWCEVSAPKAGWVWGADLDQ
jgi:hypothetical protein